MPFRGTVEANVPVPLIIWAYCAFNTSLDGHSMFGSPCMSTFPSGEQSDKERTEDGGVTEVLSAEIVVKMHT